MTLGSKSLWLGLLALTVAPLAATAWWARDGAVEGSSASDEAVAVAPSRWLPGAARIYRLELTQATEVRSDKPALAFTVSLSAELELAVSGCEEARCVLRAELRRPVLDVAGQPPEGSLGAELERPFFIAVDARGQIERLYASREASSAARGYLRAVAAGTRFVGPEPSATWSTVEEDGAGVFRVTYAHAGANTFVKRRVEQLGITTASGLKPAGQTGLYETAGETRVTLDDEGWLATLAGSESLTARPKDVPMSATSSVTVALAVLEARVASEHVGSFEDARAGLMAFRLAAFETGDQRARDERRLAGANYDAVRGELLAAEAGKEVLALRKLAAVFRTDLGAAGRAASDLFAMDLEDAAVVLGALAEAGNEPAQAALAEVASSANAHESLRGSAMAAMGRLAEPSETALDALRDGLDDASPHVRGRATLALGAAAFAAGEEGDDAVTELLARFETAATAEERALALEALGNSGDVRLLPLAARALSEEAVVVRIAAAAALRFVEDERADSLLDVALTDPADAVQRRALFALGHRPAALHVGAVGALLQRAPRASSAARAGAIERLGQWRELAAARAALAWAAEHDPDEELRRLAGALVAT